MPSNRSPRYPFFGLGDAVTRIEGIFEKEGRAPFTREVGAEHCGYSGYNGSAAKALSALKKYGFLEKVSAGFKLSQDAVKIIVLKDSDPEGERAQLIQAAAMRVELFANLLGEYGASASEKNLIAQLVIKGFSQDGAAKAARSYLSTMDFVQREGREAALEAIDEPTEDTLQSEVASTRETEPETPIANREAPTPPVKSQIPATPPGMKQDVYNFLDDSKLIIQYPVSMTPENFEELEAYVSLFLRKMKRMVGSGV